MSKAKSTATRICSCGVSVASIQATHSVCLRDGSARTFYVQPHRERSCRWSVPVTTDALQGTSYRTDVTLQRHDAIDRSGFNPRISCFLGRRLTTRPGFVCLLVGCLTSQQQASVSQGRICSDNFTCCHTEIEVADQTFYLTQSQYTDTGPTSPSHDPITPGAWQGSHWSANF